MKIDMKLYHRAMKQAAHAGVDPYDLHPVQSRKWERAFAFDAGQKAAREAREREEWEERRKARAERVYGWVKVEAEPESDSFDAWDWA